MNKKDLCADCLALLSSQTVPKHQQLVERSHIENHTIFRCSQCSAVLEQTELPCSWQLLPKPFPFAGHRL